MGRSFFESRAGEVDGLRHWDTGQLAYQVAEIVHGRSYLQHGIEIRPGDAVFDVGANAGVAAVFFARDCGAGIVHSFEPVMPLFDLLRDNVAAFPGCTPHPYGLAAEAGTAEITFYPAAASMSSLYADRDRDLRLLRRAFTNAGLPAEAADAQVRGLRAEHLECELRTLSEARAELDLECIDLLKVDVEGAELDVLRGIADADWPRIRQIVAEVHDDGHVRVIDELLGQAGYELVWDQEALMAGTSARLVFAKRSRP